MRCSCNCQYLQCVLLQVRVESEVIAQAGLPGSVTISTNMAGEVQPVYYND